MRPPEDEPSASPPGPPDPEVPNPEDRSDPSPASLPPLPPPAASQPSPPPTPEPEPTLPPEPEPERPLPPEPDTAVDISVERSDSADAEPDFEATGDDAPLQRRQGGKRVVAFVLAALLVVGAASSLQFFFQGDDPVESSSWRWASLPFPPIDPRYGHAAVWTGSKMIVWGGFSGVADEAGLEGAGIRADGAEFDPASGNWEIVPPAPVAHRPDIPAVWTGSEMIVWGGDPAQPASGAAYNPDANSWRALPPSPLPARGGQTIVWTGTEVILWGGRVAPADRPAELPDLVAGGAAYNPAANSWRDIPPAPVSPRDGHSTVWTGKEMIVWGGSGEDPEGEAARLADGGAFDPAANVWRAVAAAPVSLDGYAAWSGKEMLVWGSRAQRLTRRPTPAATPQASPTVPARPAVRFFIGALGYDPATDRWRRLPAPPLTARTNAAAAWSGSRLIVWGGLVRESNPSLSRPAAAGVAYDPESNRWEPLPESPIAGRDIGFSMIPAGNGVIVWGGKATEPGTPGRTLADGARLAPASRQD